LLVDLGAGVSRLLVDPMLNPPGAVPPVADTAPPRRNPLTPLPRPAGDVVAAADVVLVTHLHNDHFDDAARSLIPPSMPILCQPEDHDQLTRDQFTAVTAVDDRVELQGGLVVNRVAARHTLGEHAEALGPGSGYVLTGPGWPTIYLAGDCVWSDELATTLRRFAPDVVVINAGAARFLTGLPITMTADDVIAVARHAPDALIVAVHLEALNHCPMTRDDLRRHLIAAGLDRQVQVPADGAVVRLTVDVPR
jgi:L-ascorbate metabolism protein UlaG (beta-lactamase superfamily)